MSHTHAHDSKRERRVGPTGKRSGLRADARRNLERVLAAARDVLADQGPDAPLDEIARRAGVGIATLYRRFPDRAALARAVALDVWERVAHEARCAQSEEPDAFAALARYMHSALDLRIGAVMPVLVREVSMDDELRRARDGAVEPVQRLVAAAQAEGTLRADITYGDTGPLLIRLSRPLPGSIAGTLDNALAHRQLQLVLDGLRARAACATQPLPGPALTLEDLRTLALESMRTDRTHQPASAAREPR